MGSAQPSDITPSAATAALRTCGSGLLRNELHSSMRGPKVCLVGSCKANASRQACAIDCGFGLHKEKQTKNERQTTAKEDVGEVIQNQRRFGTVQVLLSSLIDNAVVNTPQYLTCNKLYTQKRHETRQNEKSLHHFFLIYNLFHSLQRSIYTLTNCSCDKNKMAKTHTHPS